MTDQESTWGPKASAWQTMVKQAESFVDMVYAPPDRHAQVNGYAELACKSVEVCIKSLLMERNLPPSFWQMCAADAEFLLNRFPVMSDDIAVPVDGDRALPIELLTRGQYSRRMCYRELSYYVPVGTPALVHDSSIKGSRLQPKCRWGIASGMLRDCPIWRCPYTQVEFRSKSYSKALITRSFLRCHLCNQRKSRCRFLEMRMPQLQGW